MKKVTTQLIIDAKAELQVANQHDVSGTGTGQKTQYHLRRAEILARLALAAATDTGL